MRAALILIGSSKWQALRQYQYDRRVARAGGALADRSSAEAIALHQAIIREIDELPVRQGGRRWEPRSSAL